MRAVWVRCAPEERVDGQEESVLMMKQGDVKINR